MVGTKAGALKAKLKNLEKDPQFFSKIGKIGGKRSTTGGFYAATPEQRREWGAKGGRKSRRGKKNDK